MCCHWLGSERPQVNYVPAGVFSGFSVMTALDKDILSELVTRRPVDATAKLVLLAGPDGASDRCGELPGSYVRMAVEAREVMRAFLCECGLQR